MIKGNRVYVCLEAGINHNGDLKTALKMIDEAKDAGADAIKFQKRNILKCYTKEELAAPRHSPFGETNGALKFGLELSPGDYEAIAAHCKLRGIQWTASVWDLDSLAYINCFDVPFIKIPSPKLTDWELLRAAVATGKAIVLSTGMSSLEEIDRAVEEINGEHDHFLALKDGSFSQESIRVQGRGGLFLLHCTSTYPTDPSELNLRCIPMLKQRYGLPVGYSGHEKGLATTIAAVALGATFIERHITLDRTAFGSDQAASVETAGFRRLVRDIRTIQQALGDGEKIVYDSELPIRDKLRKPLH